MSPSLPEPSSLLVYGFLAIEVIMATGLLYCIMLSSGIRVLRKATAVLTTWLAITGGLATAALLDTWATPPCF